MKLVIQIPAWNEEGQVGAAVRELPRSVAGFDSVEILVVDDGSTDGTAREALEAGADHVVSLPVHQGLAAAWRAGLDAALSLGADVVVSTDADRQYDAAEIPRLVAPILARQAEIVVGDRGVASRADFSPGKRAMQRLGSWAVRRASGTDVPDAASGFRALSREAALRLNVFTRMTYTTETLIQAGNKEMKVVSVPVRTRPVERPSRLVSRPWRYVLVQAANILRMTALYKPLPVFLSLAAILFLGGAALAARYVWFVIAGINPAGHVQSLLLAAVLLLTGVVSVIAGILADLISINRSLLEEVVSRQRRHEADGAGADGTAAPGPSGQPGQRGQRGSSGQPGPT